MNKPKKKALSKHRSKKIKAKAKIKLMLANKKSE
jgi:hypothetical protein